MAVVSFRVVLYTRQLIGQGYRPPRPVLTAFILQLLDIDWSFDLSLVLSFVVVRPLESFHSILDDSWKQRTMHLRTTHCLEFDKALGLPSRSIIHAVSASRRRAREDSLG